MTRASGEVGQAQVIQRLYSAEVVRSTTLMRFEWDEDKNQLNIQKPGLDFADAWEVFTTPMLTALDDRQDYGGDRWIGVGMLRTRVVVVGYPERGEDVIRVISMRKATSREREHYEQALRDRLGPG